MKIYPLECAKKNFFLFLTMGSVEKVSMVATFPHLFRFYAFVSLNKKFKIFWAISWFAAIGLKFFSNADFLPLKNKKINVKLNIL